VILAGAAGLLVAAVSAFGSPRSCDTVIRGGTVVTVDGGDHVYSPGIVVIDRGQIDQIGPDGGSAAPCAARETVDAAGRIVMPGLVNTHTHAAMSLLRGLGADMSLQEWLTKKIFPAEARNVTAAFVRDGTLLACLEMIQGGTTAFADMYYFESEAAQAVHEAGMRGVLGETFIDFPVPDHKDLSQTLRMTESFVRRWKNDPLVVPAVAPHAPYTCSRETLSAARELASRLGAPLLIHVSETRQEVEQAKQKWGKSPIQYLDSLGFFGGPPVVAAHVVWPEGEDLATLKSRGVAVAHNPESNMKLASGIAPVAEFEKRGIVWSLGTDGAASNDDLSMFEAMDMASKLAKVSTGDPTVLPARVVVRAATLGGARALGLDAKIGSLEVGKEADVILVDATTSHAEPGDDPFAMIVSSLKAADVTDVWVAGKRLLKHGIPMTLDPSGIRQKALEWRARIQKSLN
jgi:5-methylthioadenosine/S-adenosylhomocysteine deaminase